MSRRIGSARSAASRGDGRHAPLRLGSARRPERAADAARRRVPDLGDLSGHARRARRVDAARHVSRASSRWTGEADGTRDGGEAGSAAVGSPVYDADHAAVSPVCLLFRSDLSAQSIGRSGARAHRGLPGTVTLYAKNLDTGASIGIRETEPVRTASTIKLPILCAVSDQVASGKAKWTELLTIRPEDKVTRLRRSSAANSPTACNCPCATWRI